MSESKAGKPFHELGLHVRGRTGVVGVADSVTIAVWIHAYVWCKLERNDGPHRWSTIGAREAWTDARTELPIARERHVQTEQQLEGGAALLERGRTMGDRAPQ